MEKAPIIASSTVHNDLQLSLARLPASGVSKADDHVEDSNAHDNDCLQELIIVLSIQSRHGVSIVVDNEDGDEDEKAENKLNGL